MVYADDNVPQLADGYGPALARLEAAISAGRHDTLLLAGPATVRGNPARVMRLLASCTKHGVAVELLGPPAPHSSQTTPGDAPRLPRRAASPCALRCPPPPIAIDTLPVSQMGNQGGGLRAACLVLQQ